MSAEVTAAWIGGLAGLGGALVGAGSALLGGWLQQRHAAKTARRERQEGYSRAAQETTLSELLQLQQSVMDFLGEHERATEGEIIELVNRVVRHTHAARASGMLILGTPDLVRRLDEVFRLLAASSQIHQEPDQRIPRLIEFYLSGSEEGLAILSAFMRGEDLPPPMPQYLEYLNALRQRSRGLPSHGDA
ncbi:hypothetical protein [Streptomyces sp. IBSBF 3136]|uniref:hypothetical protein n=1 Tax=Streptomyces sp. IBSBF 3136 TaxID=2903524 RepID=UPI002FDBC976